METMKEILKEVYGVDDTHIVVQPYKTKTDRFLIRVTDTNDFTDIISVIIDDEVGINKKRICKVITVLIGEIYEGMGYFSKFLQVMEKNFTEIEFRFVCNNKMKAILSKKGYKELEHVKGFVSALCEYSDEGFVPVHMKKVI